MVRFRGLWVSRTDNLAALLPKRRPGRFSAVDLCGVWCRLCDAAGWLDPVRDLWRPPRPPQGIERRRLRYGAGDFCDGAAADLWSGRRARPGAARSGAVVPGTFGGRRMGRLDGIYRRIRTRRAARLFRLMAACWRWRRFSARLLDRGRAQRLPVASRASRLGMATALPVRHHGRHRWGISAL